LRQLFETPTVAGLAESIEALRWAVQPDRVLADAGNSHEEYETGEL
jgi:hypothetical protein